MVLGSYNHWCSEEPDHEIGREVCRDVGFQIVSEKFYTVDDFNPHITKCNKMIIVWHLAGSSHGKSRRYMWR
jgi:hypothetical protein